MSNKIHDRSTAANAGYPRGIRYCARRLTPLATFDCRTVGMSP